MSDVSNELVKSEEKILQETVFALRRRGLTVAEIAEHLDITEDETVVLYNGYRVRMAAAPRKRDEIKDLYDARYEHLISVFYPMAEDGDVESAKMVVTLMRDGMKIHQLDQLDPADSNVTNNILIVGEDKAAFIEALQAGRGHVAVDEKMDDEEEEHE